MSESTLQIFGDELANYCVELGFITQEQLEDARQSQQLNGGSVCDILVEKEYLESDILLGAYAVMHHVPPVRLENIDIAPDVIELIQEKVAKYYKAIPIARSGKYLTMAMADPLNVFALDDLTLMTDMKISPVLALASSINDKLDHHYHQTENFEEIIADLETDDVVDAVVEEADLNIDQMHDEKAAAPVVKLVNIILTQAIEENASDIHIEPFDRKIKIRYRIDGILYARPSPPYSLYRSIVSRMKVISQLDISERRLPQDGRFRIRTKGREVDFRVSTLPTVHGEKTVLRVLDKSSQNMDIERIGMVPSAQEVFKEALSASHGMIMVTGPTGSGKTTTLYAALTRLNAPDVNIVTVEDPVEYQFDGINQVHVNPNINLTFAAGLRSILRQDPDIVMVGEIRDAETADIAIKAALTGHLVLTTIHTNDAASAFVRLIDMGVEPYLVSSAVNIILAQRLARRLCERCKKEVEISEEVLQRAQYKGDPSEATFYSPQGCVYCRQTGYRGRVAIIEVLPVTEELRRMVHEGADSNELKKVAISNGMQTLRQVGLIRVSEGITSLEEILRVTQAD